MNQKVKEWILYGAWLFLYLLCVGLGTMEEVSGFAKVVLVLTSLIFFLPGAYLLILGHQQKNGSMILRIRIIAICSLVLTVILFCINVAVAASGKPNNFVHDLLNLVSAPMFCSQYWVLSLFGWACLLSASFSKKSK